MERLIPDFTSTFRTGLKLPIKTLGQFEVKDGELISTDKDVIKFAKAIIDRISDPSKTLDTVFNQLDKPTFDLLKTYKYLVVTSSPKSDYIDATSLTILDATKLKLPLTKPIYYLKDGTKYEVHEKFIPIITLLRNVKTKGFMESLFKTIVKLKPSKSSGNDKYKTIYDKLPKSAKAGLFKAGYNASSPEFRSLVDYIINSTAFKVRCDEDQFIDSLVSGNDRTQLKQKLEGLLKKLDLNSEDEFLKFKKMVEDTLNNQFSLFSRFKQKVIEELYKIGVPQIPLIEADFFEILNDKDHVLDIQEMRDAYADFDYDNI